MEWVALRCGHVDLEATLFSGQVFHFKRLGGGRYGGVLDGVLVVLRQQGEGVSYLDSGPRVRGLVERFLSLDVAADVDVDCAVAGLRPLTSDFYPTVFSFICSANNNVSRITAMVDYLYSKGERIGGAADAGAAGGAGPAFYRFPRLEALVDIEDELRANRFGYRAAYICGAARFLQGSRTDWTRLGCEEARARLMQIRGVGRKVADCICLVSLRHLHVVPVDTHIFQHSVRLFGLGIRRLSARAYEEIQALWRERYGEHAGIVQLHVFKARLDMRRSAAAGRRAARGAPASG